MLLKAEFIKMASTKTVLGLMVGATAVAGLGAASTIMSARTEDLGRAVHDQPFFMLASINVAMFAIVLGLRTFTDEFRYGSIVPTLLVAPDRRKVVAAKVATSAAAGAALAAVAYVVMLALALALIGAKGAESTFVARDVAALGGAVLAGGLWAAIGAAVGAIVRHQVAGVVGALVWVLLLENLGAGLLGDAARFLPGQAAHGLAQASQAGTILTPAAAAGLLVAYTVVAAGAAMLRMARTDVAPT
ncbi:MAG TPA: ABC transporter permease [Acidimicrobiales bacterium]|nr:ABC transporter permease [Acidimicrobiales bacterium]